MGGSLEQTRHDKLMDDALVALETYKERIQALEAENTTLRSQLVCQRCRMNPACVCVGCATFAEDLKR